jgi:hypothetical protein
MQRSDDMNKFEVESIIEEYEWLVSFKANEVSDLVYVVSICVSDIDFEKNRVDYIHIENIDYLYYISGGDYKIVEKCYDDFESIEKEVIKEIKSFL